MNDNLEMLKYFTGNYSKITFRNKKFQECIFDNVTFTWAFFENVKFHRCLFRNCDFSLATFLDISGYGSAIIDCQFTLADNAEEFHTIVS